MTSPTKWRLGDQANAVILAVNATYIAVIIAFVAGADITSFFGKNWTEDGFCVGEKGTPWDSHLLSFYFNCFGTVVLVGLGYHSRNRPELQLVRDNVGMVFMHGLIHLMFWWASTNSDTLQNPFGISFPDFLPRTFFFVMTWAFFAVFLRSGTFRGPLINFQSPLYGFLSTMIVPAKLLFTFAYTILVLNGAYANYINKHKDKIFDRIVICFFGPPMIVSWLEPTLCDSVLIYSGGHFWFDFSTWLSPTLCYLYCINLPPRQYDEPQTSAFMRLRSAIEMGSPDANMSNEQKAQVANVSSKQKDK